VVISALSLTGGIWLWAQDPPSPKPTFKSKVDLVVLSFTVTDSRGKYINNLKPSDFKITEDNIKQKLSTFAEGDKPAMQVMDDGTLKPMIRTEEASVKPSLDGPADSFAGTNVFVLFDTSNFMYKGFVYAEDAIADFVRGLDKADSVAVYTFSRNLSRAATLTRDRGRPWPETIRRSTMRYCWRFATRQRCRAGKW
jgi:VWFA-related protein